MNSKEKLNVEILKLVYENYPPPSTNNSRAIVIKKLSRLLTKFSKYPSNSLANEIESLIPLSIDHDDGDFGTGARGEHVR